MLPVVVGVWLTWQLQIIHERQSVTEFVETRGGMVVVDDEHLRAEYLKGYITNPDVPRKTMEITWVRRLLGDRAAVEISLPASFGPLETARVTSAFPEANVTQVVEEPY